MQRLPAGKKSWLRLREWCAQPIFNFKVAGGSGATAHVPPQVIEEKAQKNLVGLSPKTCQSAGADGYFFSRTAGK